MNDKKFIGMGVVDYVKGVLGCIEFWGYMNNSQKTKNGLNQKKCRILDKKVFLN